MPQLSNTFFLPYRLFIIILWPGIEHWSIQQFAPQTEKLASPPAVKLYAAMKPESNSQKKKMIEKKIPSTVSASYCHQHVTLYRFLACWHPITMVSTAPDPSFPICRVTRAWIIAEDCAANSSFPMAMQAAWKSGFRGCAVINKGTNVRHDTLMGADFRRDS